ncbi:hypothetical protein EW145_g80 [Phellinidium pouzarii]|uniref:Uncharacterized protein n=1 Tax=Phellinidium pouzarii TaxID=167371 RepID=A0A4S4LKE0_9AGAM|nr:hypothetical protein EW145_g80 [Phellinidium pouzarii]
MDAHTLVSHTHISSIFASTAHVTTHAVPTSRRDLPLATGRSEVPDDHASHSSIFYSPETGHVLIRIVQGGLAVELISLSHTVSPIRFVFPAVVVPNPALAAFGGHVFLIAVTSVSSLFRISLPLSRDGEFWHEPMPKNWCKEWQIRKLGGIEPKLVHVHDPHDIAIATGTGGYLRLQSSLEFSSEYNIQWSETEWKLSNWYSALLPVISTSHEHPGEIVSMASAHTPTDMSDLFTVSRDRVLRRWTVAKGCRAEISLNVGGDDGVAPLLDKRPQKLLQVLTTSEKRTGESGKDREHSFVLVFIPTPSSSTSGGIFHLYNTDRYQWNLIAAFNTSADSTRCKLQDFVLGGDKLCVLWEKQGQSVLEMAQFGALNPSQIVQFDPHAIVWSKAEPEKYNELTQEAIDELLLGPGSLTDKFLQTIMRPGLFSVITLRTALQDYKEHHLSLPGPYPPPLVSAYATLSENIAAVVGCTVTLTRDPHTGVALHKHYWNALRRDWEGFVARCKEIERSARWPVCLGLITNSQVLVVERERIGQCVEEDTPLRLHRLLSSSSEFDPVHFTLSTCWILRSKISVPLLRKIETETLNIFVQEFAFPLADIVFEASNRVFSHDDLEVELENWVTGRLENIEGFDSTLRLVLDVISGLDKAVKQEEDEVELIIPPVVLEWTRALATSYVTETVEARYDLCIAVAVLLFFMGEDLKRCDPALLGEVFSMIRGVAMCRYLCRQPAGDLEGTRPAVQEAATTDDVVSRLSSMHMSRGGKNPVPTYSLIHHFLSEKDHPPLLPAAAHHFLDRLGLFASESPAHATRSEVFVCERLRSLGYRESSRYLLSWLPRTPGVCYVLGRLWIDVGREDEAVLLLQGVAGSFGQDSVLSHDDNEALSSVLPSSAIFLTECDYYLHVAELFKVAGLTSHEVSFTKLALSVWPEGGDLNEVSVMSWAAVIKGYTDLSLYEDAYCALISSPHRDQRHQYVSHLVYKMCEDDALDRLLSMNFRGLVQEVELSLSFKARNADPRSRPNWSQILYTWYTFRGDYRNAALTMYIRSRKLSELQGEASASVDLAQQQAEALSIAINALGLIDGRNASITMPVQTSTAPPRKRRKVESYIPEDKFTFSHRSVEVVKLLAIEQEYTHLIANIELLRRDPSLVRYGELSTPWVTVSKLTQVGLYDLAMHTAKALSVDMSELFQRLALQCLRLSTTSDAILMEVATSDWLLTDKVSSWPGTHADRGWRYLRQCLERYDSVETDYSYSKAVLETILSHNASSPPPPWLLKTIEEHHPDHLIRACLRYGNLEGALENTLKMVRTVSISNIMAYVSLFTHEHPQCFVQVNIIMGIVVDGSIVVHVAAVYRD